MPLTETSKDIELLLNYDGSPEYDQSVCCARDGRHICYREPGHYGVHCCGDQHVPSGTWPCRTTWPNLERPIHMKPELPVVDFEREI